MPFELKLGIADIGLALVADDPGCEFHVKDPYNRFVTDNQPDLVLHVHCGQPPVPRSGTEVFESGGVWSLHRDGGRWWVCLYESPSDPEPCRSALFRKDFSFGELYRKSRPGLQPFPLEYPLAEVLMINLLARGRGVLLHGLGIDDSGEGILFAGVSGAGKSTMADLWKDVDGVKLLSDDRVIVRKKSDGFWIYGTPWHGDARIASPEGVPLERIFIIHHSSHNHAVPLNSVDAVSKLMARSFPTFWDAGGMAFTLDFLGQLVRSVPSYDLGVVPSREIVDYVRCRSFL